MIPRPKELVVDDLNSLLDQIEACDVVVTFAEKSRKLAIAHAKKQGIGYKRYIGTERSRRRNWWGHNQERHPFCRINILEVLGAGRRILDTSDDNNQISNQSWKPR